MLFYLHKIYRAKSFKCPNFQLENYREYNAIDFKENFEIGAYTGFAFHFYFATHSQHLTAGHIKTKTLAFLVSMKTLVKTKKPVAISVQIHTQAVVLERYHDPVPCL